MRSFGKYYGTGIPKKLYLHLPFGAIWFGSYVHSEYSIVGLENFMHYYNIKASSLLALEHLGGCDFKVEIFNCYAMEIDYGVKDIPFQGSCCTVNHVGVEIKTEVEASDIEDDKFWTTLCYNAQSNLRGTVQMRINNEHIQSQTLTKVFKYTLFILVTLKWHELIHDFGY